MKKEATTLIESVLSCPACHGGLAFNNGDNTFQCENCNTAYPVISGIIDFVPNYQGATGRAQKAMENPFISKIYENVWRPLFTMLGSKINYKDEIKWLAATHPKTAPKIILDLGCGSGKYARLLTKAFQPKLTICADLSMPMLMVAQKKAQKEGLENIVYVRAFADQLPIKPGIVDWLNCFGALHLFPDTLKALKEMKRVSVPGAVFTCLTACKPTTKKLPYLHRMVLGNTDFEFFKEDEFFKLLNLSGYKLLNHKIDNMVLLFRAERV